MRILLTGGSGAIGSFVADELFVRGHDVTVFDIEPPDRELSSFIRGDITEFDTVSTAVQEVDAVVHLAALLPDACRENPRLAERVNVGGSLNVFEAATDVGVPVVYASSKAVFGSSRGRHSHPQYEPLGEDAPKSPNSVYGTTKMAVENYANTYYDKGMSGAAVRFASTYGPGKGAAHGDLAYIPNLIRRAAAGETIQIDGADQRNDLVYYGDIANGVAAAVEANARSHTAYHIGSGQAVSLYDFAEVLRRETDATIHVNGGLNYRDSDDPSYCRLDISRARVDLGYDPSYPVDRAVRDFLDHVSADS